MAFYNHLSIPQTSGIYLILNTINNHRYIGSAVNLQNRLREHRRMLRNGTHKNPHLQAAFNHYGEDAFVTGVIELVEQKAQLLEREQFHIDTSKPEYNIVKVAGSNLGKVMSEASRRRMSVAKRDKKRKPHSEEAKAKMVASKLGKKRPNMVNHPVSQATRDKISTANTGRTYSEATRTLWSTQRKGRTHSEATKAKLSEIGKTTPNKGRFTKGNVAPNSGQFKKGQVSHNKGKSPSEVTRIRMSDAKKNNPEYIAMLIERNKSRMGLPAHNKGKPMSEEQKAKLREAHKKRRKA